MLNRQYRRENERRTNMPFKVAALMFLANLCTQIKASGGVLPIEGVGYREQELQQARGSFFDSSVANGCPITSFAGNTHIYIESYFLNDDPQSNTVLLRSVEFGTTIQAPLLTSDDAFNSNPAVGHISYRLPSLPTLFGQPQVNFDGFWSLRFEVQVLSPLDGDITTLKCSNTNNCYVVYNKGYTPIMFYVNPPVIYSGAEVEIWFNPKGMMDKIANLNSDDLPFVNTKFGKALVDFEGTVDSETTFSGWTRNRVIGRVTDQPPAGNSLPMMLWEVGNSLQQDVEMTTCLYNLSQCYKAKTVPVIHAINHDTGYITGGQNIVINGFGFDNATVDVKIAGIDCKAYFVSKTQINCTTGKTAQVSVAGDRVGQQGISRKFISTGSTPDIDTLDVAQGVYNISMVFENKYKVSDKHGNLMRTWFQPPVTAKYRFYMACDNKCKLKISNTPMQTSPLTDLLTINDATDNRDYWSDLANRRSAWVTLQKDQFYYLEGRQTESTGSDHISVGVEIENSNAKTHHHAMRQIDEIEVATTQIFEKTKFNVTGFNGGNLKFVFTNPSNGLYNYSKPFKDNGTNDEWKTGLKEYYDSVMGCDFSVLKEGYDAQDVLTTDPTLTVKYVYTVTLKKLINGVSTTGIMVVKDGSAATVTVSLPETVQKSYPPLAGKFRVKCVTKDNKVSYTNEISVGASGQSVENRINADCFQMNDKVRVTQVWKCQYVENCFKYRVRFTGVIEEQGKYEIAPGDKTPLTGDTQLTYAQAITQPQGTSVMYEVIPFDMVKSYVTKPQVMVSIGGIPAVCQGVNCDFMYTQPKPMMTSFNFDAGTKKLTITGTDLPVGADLEKIKYGLQGCNLISNTSTKIECTLENDPTIGEWKPIITSSQGLVPDSTTAEKVMGSVTMVSPQSNLNVLGEDTITFTGTNFPLDIEGSTIDIAFSNTGQTKCIVMKSSLTSLECMTEAFAVTELSQQYDATMTINGVTVPISGKFETKDENENSLSMTPLSVNPVLKRFINFTLDSNFPYTLNADDFRVSVHSKSAPNYMKRMNVVRVDDSKKLLECKFGGAISGDYNVKIHHKQWGLIDTSTLLLKVESHVSSITPTLGSVHGGTLVTLKGINWGSQKTDNPVEISYNGALGSTKCFVQETSETEIKCRIDSSKTMEDKKKGTMIVFLKTYEEANCTAASKCEFEFTNNVPVVTGIDKVWDGANFKWNLKVTGTGITGTKEDTELYIGAAKQKSISISATEANFQVTDSSSEVVSGLNLYWSVGLGNGTDKLTGVTLEPKLVSVNPKKGSAGGTIITLDVQGVGPATNGLLVQDSTGKSICQSVTIVKYSVVKCHTLVEDIASNKLKISLGGTTYECANTNDAECTYQQLKTDTTTPIVTQINAEQQTTLSFTGTNLPTTGYYGQAIFSETNSSSVTNSSANTNVKGVWDLGIPYADNAQAPVLRFEEAVSGHVYFALVETQTAYTKQVASSIAIDCSFAGGCLYTIGGQGLSSKLAQDPANNYIEVCGQTCSIDTTESTPTKTKCRVPALPTKYSNANFLISTESDDLKTGIYFGSNANYAKAFDDQQGTGTEDSASNCHVGMKFKDGFVGQISQVKYFLANIQKETYDGKLQFQASMDEQSWTTLFTVDYNVHEGWNYYKWNDKATYPKYKAYRFFGTGPNSCKIREIKFAGVRSIDDNSSSKTCDVNLFLNKQPQSLNKVTYKGDITPSLDAVNPRFGTVKGNDVITFTGKQFNADKSKYKIMIDGVECPMFSATTTEVKCTTGKRIGLPAESMTIYIDGIGYASNQGKKFTYVNMWSHTETWGGEFAPVEGESIHIPKGLNLLVDIDKSPILNAVIVEGELIFRPEQDPNHERTFDAHYIFMNKGKMQVGTEDFPYTSKITFTMYGDIFSPYIPTFGNKVIGVRQGVLDMHGNKKDVVWTQMEKTAEKGENSITLKQKVDWVVGDQIAIAPSDFERSHYEKRFITKIDNSNPEKPVLTLNEPLAYKHFAAIEKFGEEEIDMRTEVGLLTRNIKLRGDPETTSINQYGANIFIHSPGDDSVIARLSHIELTDVGQAFKVGRYAIHFHMIGAVHRSYAIGVAIHESFNRAFTIHGTYHLRLMNNVVCHAKGHNFFIEDAVEQYNVVRDNLVMGTERSWSLLNTDQTPASFWITHPDNEFTGNHAAGSDRYGYWYDLQTTALGPSSDKGGCPENSRVGTFFNNTAHSNGRYGLRIFHNMIPRKYPCKPIVFDLEAEKNGQDPFHANPIQTMRFQQLTSYKNKRNGAIALNVGDVRFEEFKTADNILAGVEFEFTLNVKDDRVQVNNSLIVGRSSNAEDWLLNSSPHGVITPKTEYFTIRNIRFWNFDFNNAAALGDCSHCWHDATTDSGARTYKTIQLKFNNVKKRIRYQVPYRGIFYDLDGSLTGLGSNTWATFNYPHLMQPECQLNKEVYDGIICNNQISVRRISIYGATKESIFKGMSQKILKYDDSVLNAQPNVTEYILDKNQYTNNIMKEKKKPSNAWTAAYVTGKKYRFHFGQTGLNFEDLKIEVSERWEEWDKDIEFFHNFSDVRVAINVTIDGVQIPNNSISSTPSLRQCGQNFVQNDTEIGPMMMNFIVNGKGMTKYQDRTMVFKGQRCWGPCQPPVTALPIETNFRYWSKASDWTSGAVPKEDEAVEIEPGWNMVLDVAETPILKMLTVNGRLSFQNDTDLHLRVKHLFVRAGELVVGYKDKPFANKARITLFGEKDSRAMVYDNAVEAGNKLIASVGNITMYGKRRDKMTRLYTPALKDATTFTVGTGLDWQAGERIALADTSHSSLAGEMRTIKTYDKQTGNLEVTEALDFYHWGQEESTEFKFGKDMRGEVALLDRNIVIAGQDIESWGCQMVAGETLDHDNTWRIAYTVIDSVEFYNCSQIDTEKAVLRFQNARLGFHRVSHSSMHNGYGWGVNVINAKNVTLEDNTLFNFRKFGIRLEYSDDITVDRNLVMHIIERTTFEIIGKAIDKTGGIAMCTDGFTKCKNMKARGNIVAGAVYVGFAGPGKGCGTEDNRVNDNVAHSVKFRWGKGGYGGILTYDKSDPAQSTCMEGSGFFAYKCAMAGVTGGHNAGPKVNMFTQNTVLDSVIGIAGGWAGGMGLDDPEPRVEVNNNKIFGTSPIPDCPQDGKGGYCHKVTKSGYQAAFMRAGRVLPHPSSILDTPYHHTMSEGIWGGYFLVKNNKFYDYKATTNEGAPQTMLVSMNTPDNQNPNYFYDNEFINCDQDNFAKMPDPSQGWANIADCGNFPCTSPKNVLWQFFRTKWTNVGKTISQHDMNGDFQVIHDNEGFAPHIDTCKKVESWNAYICKTNNFAILSFESLDADKMDRSQQPIWLFKDGTTQANKLNAYMDHCWDGFYTCQKRLQRFHGIIQGGPGSVYNITYSGSPAKSQIFTIRSINEEAGTTIRIHYPSAESRNIVKNGQIIEFNRWDEAQKMYGPITQKFCGENRYIGVKNIFEFYLTPGCILRIQPRDAIQVSVRMEWTFAEFFADGGTTKFVDRLAASLGIHGSEIKIVSVYEGSLIIDYFIVNAVNDMIQLELTKKKHEELMALDQLSLGAPILDSTIQSKKIISDGKVVAEGYKPIIITPTYTNGGKTDQNNNNNGNGGSNSNSNGGSSSNSNSNSGSNGNNYNVITGTRKEFTEYKANGNNVDPFSGIKIVSEEQKKAIDFAKKEYRRAIDNERQRIEEKYAAQRAELEANVRRSEQRQKVSSVIMITIVAALLMALVVFGMIKLVRKLSPPPRNVEEKKTPKTARDDLNNSNRSNLSQLEPQFDPNKDVFPVTRMSAYDTCQKFNQEEECFDKNDNALNLDNIDGVNILQRSPSPAQDMKILKQDNKTGKNRKVAIKVDNLETCESEKNNQIILNPSSGETKNQDKQSSNSQSN